jgi:hypothetical protein
MEISTEAAARFEMMLAAADRGNRSLAVGMLLSIPEGDLTLIQQRLNLLGVDTASLLQTNQTKGAMPWGD